MPTDNTNNNDDRKNNPLWAFENPIESGIIKPDAIDKIMADPELMAIIDKIEL